MWWFGTNCAGCGVRLALGTTNCFCEGCLPAVERAQQWRPVGTLPIAAAWAYTGPLQAWIARCKNGMLSDPRALLPPMRQLLEQVTQDDAVLLVAVPPEPTRLRQRGLHVPDLLVDQLRGPRAQRAWLLERLDRAPVRRDRVRAPPVLRALGTHAPRPIVLVDDVVTTGQTLTTAADALRGAGLSVLAAICLMDARPQVLAQVLAQG